MNNLIKYLLLLVIAIGMPSLGYAGEHEEKHPCPPEEEAPAEEAPAEEEAPAPEEEPAPEEAPPAHEEEKSM